jgi:rare lipoprotein A
VKVENLANKLSTILRVNDRGPYIGGRIIDITPRAAKEIGIVNQGIAKVSVHVIQDLIRTNNITILTKAEPSEASEASQADPSLSVKDFDPSAIFLPLTELINNPVANLHRLSWKRLNAVIQGIGEIINRSRNRRSEPFINRKR